MKKTKTIFRNLLLPGIILIYLGACTGHKGPLKLGSVPVKDIIDSMTLEEKARFVTGTGMDFEIPDSILKKISPNGKNPFSTEQDSSQGPGKAVGQTQKIVPGAAGTSFAIPGLGITPMVLSDGPAGLRIQPKRAGDSATYYCTAFPIGTLLASSWDTALVKKVGQAMGNEVLEYGADVILGPALNIHRNPLCGRNFEYYSEDPLVSGKVAAAMVKGIQSQGVGTSIKHFAANNQEKDRNSVNDIVSERALREIYLRGFEITVKEAQPWTVMSSYNKINGTYTSESYDLLTKVLRDDWGFKGYVMTDWFGGTDAVAQMKAGNDLLMPGTPKQAKEIVNAVKEGKLDIKVLDKNIERILTILQETPRFKGYKYSNKPDLKAHALVTREAAAEGMVLLKNEKEALPFKTDIKKVATFGNASFETIIGGTGSGDVNEAYHVSVIDGLKNAGLHIDDHLKDTYLSYIKKARANHPKSNNWLADLMGVKSPAPEMTVDMALANKEATAADIALITIGRNSGEGADRNVEGDFNLTETEKTMINNVSKAFQAKGKKAIVLLNIGGVVEIASWRNAPDAILLTWQPGEEAGNSIVDILTGKVDPSGKLTSSFPMKYNDVPSANYFPGIELPLPAGQTKPTNPLMPMIPAEVVYEEGIYVGYRYYNTFNIPTAYEFGYGLSYTTFEYNNIKVSAAKFNDQLTVTVDIKNTGKVAGKEVAQVYLSAPARKMDKPAMELIAFAKTRLLNPGETQTLNFVITGRDLASFDTPSSSWIAEAGKYLVKIGASSKNIRQSASFDLDKELMVEKVSKALTPNREIKKFPK